MKTNFKIIGLSACLITVVLFSKCQEKKSIISQATAGSAMHSDFNGFESQVKWGEHLVIISGCHDCHTPKKMSAFGPVLDSALWLSGHPASMPPIDINRKEIESKGLAVTSDLTEWVGPWGVSYSANLTPDATGIGTWSEEQFILCLRKGKYKGLEGSRTLLPPMPWPMVGQMTDNELKAVFAYLKTIKPIVNLVSMPKAPESMIN
ncbi:MAG: diheme cytochrome c-553 [Cyclobacteriaceae bacterium]|nr:diheme cytochrome c-553 [Cyclobacteriaceae bacterium]